MMNELKRRGVHVGQARLKGRLFNIGWYPGFVESRDARHVVVGDVFELPDDADFLARLDKYEQASTRPGRRHEYLRKRKIVTMSDGRRTTAWVYIYNWPIDQAQEIVGGDFMKHNRAKRPARRTTARSTAGA